MKALGGKWEEERKETIRGKLGWIRMCGSKDINPELRYQ